MLNLNFHRSRRICANDSASFGHGKVNQWTVLLFQYKLTFVHCRFQACGHITRLLATTKRDGILRHVLEPIQCSVRQHLSAGRPTVASLRRLLLQLLRGLDYLHDRGWVHFDLSLDSVAVSVVAQFTVLRRIKFWTVATAAQKTASRYILSKTWPDWRVILIYQKIDDSQRHLTGLLANQLVCFRH